MGDYRSVPLLVLLALLLPVTAQAHRVVHGFTYYSLPVVFNGHAHSDFVEATRYGDELYGRGGWDRLRGMAGRDLVYGNGGDDTLYGDRGADVLYGSYGNDYINGGKGEDWCYGGPGLDIFSKCEHVR